MTNGSKRRGPLLAATIVTVTVMLTGGAWWLYGTDDSTPKQRGGTSAKTESKPLDLEVFDWRNAVVPGGLCRHQGSISLRDGTATNVPSTFDGPEPNMPQDVAAFTDQVVYGDLTGDGRWEAALPVLCANHDSTAAGQRSMGVMVFDGATGRLHHIGTLTSQQPRLGEPPNNIRIEKITRGLITATETFYGTADANCCPSGLADNTWHFTHGKLVPESSRVRATPSAAPS